LSQVQVLPEELSLAEGTLAKLTRAGIIASTSLVSNKMMREATFDGWWTNPLGVRAAIIGHHT